MSPHPAERRRKGGKASDGGTDLGQLERWILAVARDRDTQAFADLFLEMAPRLKTYLMRLGLCGAAVDDLIQETMAAIWRKAYQFDPERGSAEAWVYTIARNRRIDSLRWTKNPLDLAFDPIPPATTPEEHLAVFQDERQVRLAVRALPSAQAELVDRSFFRDHSHDQIARELGIPIGTVKSRLRLASGRLREMLKDSISAA